MTRADLEKNPEQVAAMFDEVAETYDRTNDALSFGQDRVWRRAVKKAVDPQTGQRILDLAAGTGSSSAVFLKPGVEVVAADFSRGMLEVGKAKHPELEFVYADATQLPFANQEFDTVTISFGLRNVTDVNQALAEMLRVTKPGGKLVICEFSRVRPTIIRGFYRLYLKFLLPFYARLLAKNAPAYNYLAESIEAWPDQEKLAAMISKVGYQQVRVKNLSFGVVAIHMATKPTNSAAVPNEHSAGAK